MSIERIKTKIGFSKFSLDTNNLTPEQADAISKAPRLNSKCRVKLNPAMKSSAYGQMWEYAHLCGFIDSERGVKALVVFTEREDADGDEDFAFVDLSQLKEYKVERVREFKLKSY